MKSRFAIAFVITLALLLPFSMVAQGTAPVQTQAVADLSVGHGLQTGATFGFFNLVTATYRHCAEYSKKTGHLWWKKTAVDQEACAADPSTVFATTTHHNLTTNVGKDFIKAQVSGTGVAANCSFIAVGNTVITAALADTTLTGEVTTNGLGRASGTYASTSTAATPATFTLAKTFTGTGTTSGVVSAAVFTAVSAGTMCFEVSGLGPVTINSTDTLAVTWTGSIT